MHSDTYGEIVSVGMAFVFNVIILVIAIAMPLSLRPRKSPPNYEKSLGDSFVVLRMSSKWSKYYYTIFVIRRVFFVLTVFFLEDYLLLQVFLFLLGNLGYLMYLIYGKPLIVGLKLEIFNEMCNLCLSYLMIFYTGLINDSQLEIEMGYAFVGVFLLNVVTNFLILGVSSVIMLFK
jgi:hypothetical protein